MNKYVSHPVIYPAIKIDLTEAEFEEMTLADSQIDPARIKSFEQLPARSRYSGIEWTKEQDALLLKYWPIKDKQAVARALGVGVKTVRKRYRQLISTNMAIAKVNCT